MLIQIDTREKPQAIRNILTAFDAAGVEYIRSKLYVGDYLNYDDPRTVIDRKRNIRELATNCTSERRRVEAELHRAKKHGIKVIFLIEEATCNGKPIHDYSDIMTWTPPRGFGTVSGYQVFRTMAAWSHHYNCEFVFCRKKETGRMIIKLLGGGNGQGKGIRTAQSRN